MAVSFTFPPTVQEHSLFSTPSPVFIVCRLFDDDHSEWCEMIFHYGFDLHFSNYELCWAYFHVFVSHLYVFFGEMSAMSFFYSFFLFIYLFTLLYSIVLVLPYIDKNPPWMYMCSPSWTPLPRHLIPLGHPSAPAPSTLYHASELDWWFVSHMIIYMFQWHSPKLSHPRPLPQSPKDSSIHLCLFCCLTYRVIVTIFSKFHIYALVYCIGVFLSGLLHSV